MFADDPPVLAQDYAVSIDVDVDGATNGTSLDRVLVVVDPHQAGLGHRCRGPAIAVKRPPIADQARPLGLEHGKDRLVLELRMRLLLGIGDALVEQPAVEVVECPEPRSRHEQLLTQVSTCPFSQPAPGVHAVGSTKWWLHIARKRRLNARSFPT